MKYLFVFLLLSISIATSAQDLKYKLATTTHKTWIGYTTFGANAEENFTNLTFHDNFKVEVYDRRYKVKKEPKKWYILQGDMATDDAIFILIGNNKYQVSFSNTSNGKEFLTLTHLATDEDDIEVVRNFYAE
jgi:hypothetical protein